MPLPTLQAQYEALRSFLTVGVADSKSCFRSYSVPANFDLTSKEYITSLVNVICNFLNYLLHHDVCPEYEDQVQASKLFCDQGERELWAVAQNIIDLPGNFNKACSELYGGVFQGQWAASSTWLTDEEIPELSQGISPALARQVFKMGIVANTSNEQFEKYEKQNKTKSIHVTSVEDVSMEVVGKILSSADVQRLYVNRGSLKPLGELFFYPLNLENSTQGTKAYSTFRQIVNQDLEYTLCTSGRSHRSRRDCSC